MAATGYTRQSAAGIVDTAIITASLFNAEYSLLETAFSASDGHTHSGAPGQGGRILAIGPSGELTVGGTSVLPSTNNAIDLGSTGLGFKDLYIKGDASVVGNAAIGGALTVAGIVSAGNATAGGHLLNRTTADARYAQLAAANIFTANQTINKAGPNFVLNKTVSGGSSAIYGQLAGAHRWRIDLGSATAEAGANSGSDFTLVRYDDAGTSLGNVLSINRATSAWSIGGVVTLNTNTASTSTTTGALIVTGGVGIGGAVNIGGAANVGGALNIASTTASTTNTTGALVVAGGLGVAGAINLGGSLTATTTGADSVLVANAPAGFSSQFRMRKAGLTRWQLGANNAAESGLNVGSDFLLQRFNDAGSVIDTPLAIARNTGVVSIPTGIASSSLGTGALVVNGGLGVSGNLFAGRFNLDPSAYLTLSSGNPLIGYDANDYRSFDRASNTEYLIINSSAVTTASPSGIILHVPTTVTADPTAALGVATKRYADAQRMFRNKLINSGFVINQREVAAGVTLAPHQYAQDRWKAGASGAIITVGSGKPSNTMNITSGSMLQVIEGINIQAGTYVLSWTGTAKGRVGAAAYATSPIVAGPLAAGDGVIVEFTGGTVLEPQLELGSFSTPWEFRPEAVELVLCQRFYQGGVDYRNGYGTAGATESRSIIFPTLMRVTPTLTLTPLSLSNASAPGGSSLTNIGFELFHSVGVSGYFTSHTYWIASAEL